jgi:hypothetical protein
MAECLPLLNHDKDRILSTTKSWKKWQNILPCWFLTIMTEYSQLLSLDNDNRISPTESWQCGVLTVTTEYPPLRSPNSDARQSFTTESWVWWRNILLYIVHTRTLMTEYLLLMILLADFLCLSRRKHFLWQPRPPMHFTIDRMTGINPPARSTVMPLN